MSSGMPIIRNHLRREVDLKVNAVSSRSLMDDRYE